MTVPMLGPLTMSGFEHKWWFSFVFVVVGLIGLYVLALISRRRRLMRFANMDILERVAPTRSRRWRHLPAILLVVALLASTVGLAGPTHAVQIPRKRGRHVIDPGVAGDDRHRHGTEQAGRRPASR
ncbi:hypothetical protein MSTO_53250 [Mycobacterium stomatepiae]|uniref:Aerotolerance regulator N-terminal domain-containing protein n=1 Tax=Mycobacterium stomatepiae TaxID=470076 RepID=A0A7I7QG50_9MYCO|nr:hypothetical protein MSTO_53250 [Mycobacterium stomatepiae]